MVMRGYPCQQVTNACFSIIVTSMVNLFLSSQPLLGLTTMQASVLLQ